MKRKRSGFDHSLQRTASTGKQGVWLSPAPSPEETVERQERAANGSHLLRAGLHVVREQVGDLDEVPDLCGESGEVEVVLPVLPSFCPITKSANDALSSSLNDRVEMSLPISIASVPNIWATSRRGTNRITLSFFIDSILQTLSL